MGDDVFIMKSVSDELHGLLVRPSNTLVSPAPGVGKLRGREWPLSMST